MAGNSAATRMVLQARDRRLLGELHALRVARREDAATVAAFGSVTRVNARLLALTRAGYLRRVAAASERGGRQYLYIVTRRGAAEAGVAYVPVPLKARTLVGGQPSFEHQLRLNALYLRLAHGLPAGSPVMAAWRTFSAEVAPGLRLIPDAYFELDTAKGPLSVFVEIDQGTESHRVWRGKVEAYMQLAASGAFGARFRRDRFRVAVVVPSVRRVRTLQRTVAALTTKLFWLATHDAASGDDPLGPTWYRPSRPDPEPFI